MIGESRDKRVQRTLDYIDTHLAEDLSVDVLSRVAALSKFHFHRQFAEWTGVSVQTYVQLARARLAAHRLAFRTEVPVAEIAFDCGYGSPEAFSRMFKQHSGLTPSEFRVAPQWPLLGWETASGRVGPRQMPPPFDDQDVRLVNFVTTPVAVLEHCGNVQPVADSIRRFIAWRKRFGLPPTSSATFNLLYSDPAAIEREGFRLAICAATRRDVPPNPEGVVASVIPGGRCAQLRLQGTDNQIRLAAEFLCGSWLSRSGARRRNFPLFVERHVTFPDVPETRSVIDLYLPLSA